MPVALTTRSGVRTHEGFCPLELKSNALTTRPSWWLLCCPFMIWEWWWCHSQDTWLFRMMLPGWCYLSNLLQSTQGQHFTIDNLYQKWDLNPPGLVSVVHLNCWAILVRWRATGHKTMKLLLLTVSFNIWSQLSSISISHFNRKRVTIHSSSASKQN